MLFANVCAGFIRSCYGEFWEWHWFIRSCCGEFWEWHWFIRSCYGEFWEWHFLGFLAVLCAWEVPVLLVPLLRTRLGLHWCASRWTRLFGGGRWGHYLCNHWRECQAAHKIAYCYFWFHDCFMIREPEMLVLAGRPSLHGYDACMVFLD